MVINQRVIKMSPAFPHLERQGFLFYIQFSEIIESQSNIFTNKTNNFMKKKAYLNPESELLIVRFEGNFCQTGYSPEGTVPETGEDDDQGGF